MGMHPIDLHVALRNFPKAPLKGAYRQDWLSRTLVELARREGEIA